MSSLTLPREEPRALRNLPVFFGKREAEDAGMGSVGQFPKGSVPGLRHQWNCDLLPLLQASICSTPYPLSFKAAFQNISVSLLLHFVLLPSPFPCHTLSVMYAFIPPNNFIHHPIRGGKPFITCPHRCNTARWERVRKKGKWEDQGGEKWAEGRQGNRENEMTLLFH